MENRQEFIQNFGVRMNRPNFVCNCMRLLNLNRPLPNSSGIKIKDKNKDKEVFLPLRNMDVSVEVTDGIAIIQLIQQYLNPTDPIYCEPHVNEQVDAKAAPIEAIFKFPKDDRSLISKMTVSIGERTIEAKIMENEKA
jgi:hypothetical protein